MKKKRTEPTAEDDAAKPIRVFADALRYAEPRPSDTAKQGDKKNYSERLSNAISRLLARRLRSAHKKLRAIKPFEDGTGRESPSASGRSKKNKKVDVRHATERSGLELLVSVKTLNFRDVAKRGGKPILAADGKPVLKRYTKNMVRNDHELRAEAEDHHERFPYAVLVAIFFLPNDACDDGGKRPGDVSSFAHAVRTLRERAGRNDTNGPKAKFERIFVGLYEPHGVGDCVAFFDVMDSPPRKGSPPRPDEATQPIRGRKMMTLDQLVEAICHEFEVRNRIFFRYADEDAI